MTLLVNREGWLDKDFALHASLSHPRKRIPGATE
jgi:hypothetical protein